MKTYYIEIPDGENGLDEYCVVEMDGVFGRNEAGCYYTPDYDDALGTMKDMMRRAGYKHKDLGNHGS